MELGKLLSKVDFDPKVKSVFLSVNQRQFFTKRSHQNLQDFVFLNCFMSLLISYLYGENRREFVKYSRSVERGKFQSLKNEPEVRAAMTVLCQGLNSLDKENAPMP